MSKESVGKSKTIQIAALFIVGVLLTFGYLAWLGASIDNYSRQTQNASQHNESPYGYFQLFEGQLAICLGFLVLGAWILILCYDVHLLKFPNPKKTAVAAILLLVLFQTTMAIPHVNAEPSAPDLPLSEDEPVTLNFMVYFDEECTSTTKKLQVCQALVESYFLPGTTIESPHKMLWEHFHIDLTGLNVHNATGEEWSSSNGTTYAQTLIDEGIEQKNGTYEGGKWIWRPRHWLVPEGGCQYWADPLFFFTGQDLTGGSGMPILGYAPDGTNCIILSFSPLITDLMEGMTHEISHLFPEVYDHEPARIEDVCIMNRLWRTFHLHWCAECAAKIEAHRELYGYKEWAVILPCNRTYTQTTTLREEGTYQFVRGSQVSIAAQFDSFSFILVRWLARNLLSETLTESYENPLCFCMPNLGGAKIASPLLFVEPDVRIKYWLSIEAYLSKHYPLTGGCTTNPPPGSDYCFGQDIVVHVEGVPAAGFEVKWWQLTPMIITAASTSYLLGQTVNVTMASHYLLEAVFKFICDINEDLKVDIKDVAPVSSAFGSYPGHPKWNEKADINHNGKVDIKDLAPVSGAFGWYL